MVVVDKTLACRDVSPDAEAARAWPFLAPTVALLFVWMIVPLGMTLWFSFQRYNLLNTLVNGFAGFENYRFLLEDQTLWASIGNSVVLVALVLGVTLAAGTGLALLFDQEFLGRGVARLLVIAPFFIMPTVSALIWKNLLMHPVNGLIAAILDWFGRDPIDFLTALPLASIAMIVAWQWIPFATLILLTALQSLDHEQIEAARMDGARGLSLLRFIVLPHLARPISIVLLMETMYLVAIFAEIHITTSGGPGQATTTLAYLIFSRALLDWDVGSASAGAIFAIILANVLGFFLVRTIAKNIDA